MELDCICSRSVPFFFSFVTTENPWGVEQHDDDCKIRGNENHLLVLE